MPNRKISIFKFATILLAISFFIQLFTVIGIVFFRGILLKADIFPVFAELHEYNGFLLAALVLAHLYFNRGWIRSNILKGEKR